MSKIDDLIDQFCPKGVHHELLSSVTEIRRGSTITKSITSEGSVPVLAGGQNPAYFHNVSNRNGQTIVIAGSGAYAGFVTWWEIPVYVSDAFSIKPLDERLNAKFCFYFLKNLQAELHDLKSGGGVPHVYGKDVGKFIIPVPPLEIQKEIVAILDKFTELKAELEAELEARKTQYEFYRESLFGHAADAFELKAISDIATIWRGRRFVKDDIQEEGVPAVHYGEIYTKYGLEASEAFSFLDPELAARLRFAKSGDVILVSAGETIEDIGKSFAWFGKEDVVIHDACYGLRSIAVDPKYMVHFFNTHYFRSQLRMFISSSKISAISTEKLGKVMIPVPALERQKQIANLLDGFDTVITNVSDGLPAEIKARHQQYEYYRNKLLTFKELDVA